MRVTVKEWAARNGVSERAVRARLARGTLPGTKERDPGTGAEQWYVDLPEHAEHHTGTFRHGAEADGPHHSELPDNSLGDLVQLLREKDRQILELSGRLGFVMGQNEELRGRIALLEAPKSADPAPESVPATGPASSPDSSDQTPMRPPWWAFWRRGAATA